MKVEMSYLRDLNYWSICLRILLAVFCGGIIGMERGVRGKVAGFRTHILVCVGAAMTSMTGQYIILYVSPGADPARLGAQVISGIGFLGVGTIITSRTHRVRGLTTAAGLWTSACLGLAIGIGFYEAAVVGAFAVTMAMVAFQKVNRYFYSRRYVREYCIEADSLGSMKRVIVKIKEADFVILGTMLEHDRSQNGGNVTMVIMVKRKKHHSPEEFQFLVGEAEGILFVEEI